MPARLTCDKIQKQSIIEQNLCSNWSPKPSIIITLNNSQISPPEVQLELPDAETVKSRQICKLNYNSELLGAETLPCKWCCKDNLACGGHKPRFIRTDIFIWYYCNFSNHFDSLDITLIRPAFSSLNLELSVFSWESVCKRDNYRDKPQEKLMIELIWGKEKYSINCNSWPVNFPPDPSYCLSLWEAMKRFYFNIILIFQLFTFIFSSISESFFSMAIFSSFWLSDTELLVDVYDFMDFH